MNSKPDEELPYKIVRKILDTTDQRQPDRVIGRAFIINDMIGGFSYFVGDFQVCFPEITVIAGRTEFLNRDASNMRKAPGSNLAVAVLSKNIGVNVSGINTAMAAD